MRRSFVVATLLVCAPPAARADAVADEVSTGTTLATATTPSSSWVANRISGVWDVDDSFTLQVDFGVTRSTTYSKTGALSLAFTASDHWSLSVAGSWVPAATSSSTTTLALEELEDEVTLADAELSATSSHISLAASATYDTAGDSDHETTASVTLGVDHAQSQQTFASVGG